jgi:hypothetical protein
MSERLEQVSVPLPAELVAFVDRRAHDEERSRAAVIRRLIAEAARVAGAIESRQQSAA